MKRSYITGNLALYSAIALATAGAAPAAPPRKAPAPAAGAPAVEEVGGFKLESGISMPALQRSVGGKSSVEYPFDKMAVDQSFLVPVTVADTITDQGERDKAFKEEARKVSNRMSGAIRRYRKTNGSQNFAMRTVNDDKLGHGVRIWRVADTASEPAAA